MHYKIKSAFFSILPIMFILLSIQDVSGQDTNGKHRFIFEDFQILVAQSDFIDEEFYDDDLYFPDELMEEDPALHVADPLRPFNVAMFHFNDKLYFWVLKPVAKGWRTIAPETVRTGVNNFFYNLGFPIRFVSSILQLKGDKATGEVGRFFLNTIFGVLGFGNPAKNFAELNPDAEDLGQTFGHYGIGHGIYLVLPFWGPSSLRDGVGFAGDRFLDPVSYVDPWELRAGVTATETVNKTSFRIGDYEAFKEAAIEPYGAMKSGYLQRRLKSVNN
jgi:phospholipid-binding lipoprotein MlaA